MNLRMFLTVSALIAGAFGVLLVVIPHQFLAVFGLTLDPAGELLGRYNGAGIGTLGLFLWLARTEDGTAFTRAALLAGVVYNGIGLAVALWGTLGGVMSAVGWVAVVLHLALLAGSAYFLSGRR